MRFALALAATTLLACNGCNHDGAPPPPNAADAPTGSTAPNGETVVHVEDDGKSFDVARGSTVTFQLASNAGTGYAWTPAAVDPNVLVQQGERTTQVSSDVPGAPKMDVFRFVAQSPGTATVEMDLKRPWEHGAAPGRSVRVTIHVQ